MLDHVTLRVSDYERSKAFYTTALAPLDYSVMAAFEHEGAKIAGFGWTGPDGRQKVDWWIVQLLAGAGADAVSGPTHLALTARDRARVDAFHAAAIAAGGRDNGPPGLRPHYHQHYYGAFARDPDGNNIEAVCHAPVTKSP